MIGQLEQQWQDFSGMYLNIGHLYELKSPNMSFYVYVCWVFSWTTQLINELDQGGATFDSFNWKLHQVIA